MGPHGPTLGPYSQMVLRTSSFIQCPAAQAPHHPLQGTGVIASAVLGLDGGKLLLSCSSLLLLEAGEINKQFDIKCVFKIRIITI